MKSKWGNTVTDGYAPYYEIKGKEPRPTYCDRGNWIAKVQGELLLSMDHQDGWPRYYFDFDRAKLEIEDWMKKRGQWV